MRIETKKISEINRAAYNPRVELQPGDEEYESIRYSLGKYGLVQPIVWNQRTNTVVSGHQRLNVLEAQGETEVQVSVVDLDIIQEKQLNAVLNKAQGRWDDGKLYTLLDELGEDARHTGFTDEELETLKEAVHYFDDPELQSQNDAGDDGYFALTLTFDETDGKSLKSYIKKNGDAGIIKTIISKAKGEI